MIERRAQNGNTLSVTAETKTDAFTSAVAVSQYIGDG